jgi:peptidoglycan/xylan/chitin deacetylase (PgdA/CDA1 family)
MRPRSAGALLGLGALGAWCGPAAAAVFPPLAAVYRIPLHLPGHRGIALTFDDGPHPQGTPAVLAALDRAGLAATFFLVGEQVDRNPSLVSEIVAAGHEVAIHGYVHRLLLRRTPRELDSDFDRAAATIAGAAGRESAYYRPPYGIFSAAGLELARRRWEPVLWSRWGRDWERRATAASIAGRVTRELGGGDILLLHDADDYSAPGSWRATVAALPAVFEAIAASGEPVLTLGQACG